MRRALKSSVVLGVPMPSEEDIRIKVGQALKLNPFPIGRLRICISENGLVISHDEYLEATENGFLTFSPHTSKSRGEQYKTYPYQSRYEVVDEARAHGFDDAIVFNSANNVTETGISNIAFNFDGVWVTPPISAGILPGVMRAIAIERCGVAVKNVHITEVPEAAEIVLLSSLKIAQPVQQLGEMKFPCGPMAQALVGQIRDKVEYFSVG